MAQGQLGHGVHVRGQHLVAAVQHRVGAGGLEHHQVAAHAIGRRLQRQCGGVRQHRIAPVHLGQRRTGGRHTGHQRGLFGGGALQQGLRVAVKGQAHPYDGLAQHVVRWVFQHHRQTEAVQQLGAQLAFFRVHRAHQHKARRVLA